MLENLEMGAYIFTLTVVALDYGAHDVLGG